MKILISICLLVFVVFMVLDKTENHTCICEETLAVSETEVSKNRPFLSTEPWGTFEDDEELVDHSKYFVLSSGKISMVSEDGKFELSIDIPQTTLKIDEEITVTASLKNLTTKNYLLVHPIPSIIHVICRPPDERGMLWGFGDVAKTEIGALENITETLALKKSEAGEYILRASCNFEADGGFYHFNQQENIIITVVE